jgi:parallel beta-helix repeat protein
MKKFVIIIGVLGFWGSVFANTFLVTSNANSGAGTLRWAITQANSNSGADTITFSTSMLIGVTSDLPELTDDGTVIDASEHWVLIPGHPGVTLNSESGSNTGFIISGARDCEVKGLGVSGFVTYGIHVTDSSRNNRIGSSGILNHNAIYDNGGGLRAGIHIEGNSDSNYIENNYIGIVNGTPHPNARGIFVDMTSGHTYIGNNVICASDGDMGDGIYTVSDSNYIYNNKIGTGPTGTTDMGNERHGIYIYQGSFNTIEQNVVSGNDGHGIKIYQADDNIIIGNLIGTDINGTTAMPNDSFGICITTSDGTIIGGDSVSSRNIISSNRRNVEIDNSYQCLLENNYIGTNISGTFFLGGNTYAGVHIDSGGGNTIEKNIISGCHYSFISYGLGIKKSDYNTVIGNFIGTDASGTQDIGNYGNGIDLRLSSTYNQIGGASEQERNIISGNGGYGIYIHGSWQNDFYGNYIGTDITGTLPIPNDSGGICCMSTHNTIGGTGQGEGNIIAFNNGNGIYLGHHNADWNAISGNSIFENELLGIDLWPEGVTLNDSADADSGANENLNFPVIDSAGVSMVWGTASENATVEIFLADNDPSDYGEGKTFLASGTADASGDFSIAISGVNIGDKITATARDTQGNTSEFSENCVVTNVGVQENANVLSTVYSFNVISSNPFSRIAKLKLQAPFKTTVSLCVYDITGQLVRMLMHGQIDEGGEHIVLWDGKNEHGEQMSNGIYFCKLESDDYKAVEKLVLIQ